MVWFWCPQVINCINGFQNIITFLKSCCCISLNLQRIGYNLTSYIQNMIHSPWILSGSSGVEVKCKILTDNIPIFQTKIGSNWKEFCKIHKLKEGHRCVFSVALGDARIIDILNYPSWDCCWFVCWKEFKNIFFFFGPRFENFVLFTLDILCYLLLIVFFMWILSFSGQKLL